MNNQINNNTLAEKVTVKDVLIIALPMILATISIPFLGFVDTTIAGHLENADYLSAVEVGDTIFSFIYMLFSFLRLAVTGLTAQAVGKQAREQQLVVLVQALLLSSCLGLILAWVSHVLLSSILGFVSSDPHVQELSVHYLNIRLLSVPAALGNLVISAFLLGMKQAKFAMYLLLVINTTAMILDVLLAYHFRMGINGLSCAIVLGQYMGFICGIRLVLNVMNIRLVALMFKTYTYLTQGISKFFYINQNLFIRSVCFITVYGIFLATSARLGTLILAANSILLAFYSFISLGLEGFANAAEVLIGHAIGKGNLHLLRQSIILSASCALVTALGIALVYIIAGRSFINWMTDLSDVRLLSSTYLIWVSILPLICVWCYLLDAIFLGMLRVTAMRNSLLIATFVFFVPVWEMTQSLGNAGLWISLLCFFIGRTAVLIIDLWVKPMGKTFPSIN